MQIRDARASDWPQIRPFLHEILHAGETYAWDVTADEEAEREFWMGHSGWPTGGPHRVSVAVHDDRVVGTAKMGPIRPGRGSHVATASFVVDPAAGVRGAGRALGEDMLAWAARSGYRAVQFQAVVETNTRAVHLWTSLGFRVVGTVPEAFDSPTHGLVGLHVMHRAV
ncbi:MAG TPA: GNAT family N-acetyltransferase [Ornithinicoccus sp.]|nr:GNAT family N-acetyltransferase [Ornithinicoccus sp.]